MRHLWRALPVMVMAVGVLTTPAAAAPDTKLGGTLGALWQDVIETPTPENVFNGGDHCIDLGGVLAPFAPFGTSTLTCTVKPGTKIFVTPHTSECSTLEAPPYYGGDEAELRACARAVDAGVTGIVVTLDGEPVAVREVESGLLSLDLPADNIFGAAAGTGEFSLAHGWVVLLHPLTPGAHEITVHAEGTYLGAPHLTDNTTTIIVEP